MLRALIVSIIVLVTSFSSAEARHYRHHQAAAVRVSGFDPLCNITMPCEGVSRRDWSAPKQQRVARADYRGVIVSKSGTRLRYSPSPIRQASTPLFDRGASRVTVSVGSRPADCYGIPWCGCYLRHVYGIADKSLNLARNWASVGSRTTAHAGAVVVWNHHVGVLQSDPDARGYAVVLSGNAGRGGVNAVPRYVGNAIAFRSI